MDTLVRVDHRRHVGGGWCVMDRYLWKTLVDIYVPWAPIRFREYMYVLVINMRVRAKQANVGYVSQGFRSFQSKIFVLSAAWADTD